jgi:formate dehydrogenase maturation protein FdhE
MELYGVEYPIQNYEMKEQIKKTNLEKNGFDNGLKNKEKIWEKNLYKDFKLTKEQYFDMGVQQNGCCAICKTKPKGKLVVDHCHTRGNVRGLLCNLCNAGIGFLKESEEIFLSALTYLKTR